MDLSSIKSSDSISLKSDSARSFNEDDQNDGNHFLQSPDSQSGSLSKKGSQSSFEFGRGEIRDQGSPLPDRSPNMLKHASSGGGAKKVGTVQTSQETSTSLKLPQRFVVKYLGFRETSNLWGIKYTRRPVDEMVNDAKTSLSKSPEKALALLRMDVTEEGIAVGPMPQNINPNYPNGKFAIESISYGVQDLVYTRVFAMIVVRTDKGQSEVKLSQLVNQTNGAGGTALPFRCHAFVCDSRQTARRLTYSLASAFEIFSKKVAAGKISAPKPKKFAIDLRPSEEIEAELQDSEA